MIVVIVSDANLPDVGVDGMPHATACRVNVARFACFLERNVRNGGIGV